MNQYQRMVSYLYEYKQGVKGINVGYVRIEQRGTGCRISLQMRSGNLGQLSDVAVFRQGREGIRYYTIGTLTERNGDYRCRIETESGNLMESGINISDVDGIILYQDDTYYVATTWKNQSVWVGESRIWDPAEPEDMMEPETAESEPMEPAEIADAGQRIPEQGSQEHEEPLMEQSQDTDGVHDRAPLAMNGNDGNQLLDDSNMGDPGEEETHKEISQLSVENRIENNERRYLDGNRYRDGEGRYFGENWGRDGDRRYLDGNWGRDGDRRYLDGNWGRDGDRRYLDGNWGRDGDRRYLDGNWGRDGDRRYLDGYRDRDRDRRYVERNQDQNNTLQSLGKNEEQKNISASPGQNGMAAMGQRFPRWGGMPFFRRRPMGNAGIPIPQMGEWSNGKRYMAESREADHADNPESDMNVMDQEKHICEPSQESKKQREEEAVCRNCPFKRKGIDYGKRILMTFPVMRPFPNNQRLACVRIEPQDLGCLPMQMWTLANNHFLLQGYYCYRHLIFMETEERSYALGVPGIYDKRTCRQAERFGFPKFRAICAGKQCEGAFGYWIMPLSQL